MQGDSSKEIAIFSNNNQLNVNNERSPLLKGNNPKPPTLPNNEANSAEIIIPVVESNPSKPTSSKLEKMACTVYVLNGLVFVSFIGANALYAFVDALSAILKKETRVFIPVIAAGAAAYGMVTTADVLIKMNQESAEKLLPKKLLSGISGTKRVLDHFCQFFLEFNLVTSFTDNALHVLRLDRVIGNDPSWRVLVSTVPSWFLFYIHASEFKRENKNYKIREFKADQTKHQMTVFNYHGKQYQIFKDEVPAKKSAPLLTIEDIDHNLPDAREAAMALDKNAFVHSVFNWTSVIAFLCEVVGVNYQKAPDFMSVFGFGMAIFLGVAGGVFEYNARNQVETLSRVRYGRDAFSNVLSIFLLTVVQGFDLMAIDKNEEDYNPTTGEQTAVYSMAGLFAAGFLSYLILQYKFEKALKTNSASFFVPASAAHAVRNLESVVEENGNEKGEIAKLN